MKPKIYPGVRLGADCIIDEDVEIGRPPVAGPCQETIIGARAHIRKGTIIYAGVTVGAHLTTGHCALIREGNAIGDFVSIGSFAELAPGNRVGDYTRIHSRCFLEDVTIGQHVFVGPGVIFTNDPHPPSGTRFPSCLGGATVEDGAMIGGGVVVLPHVRIGKRALVGAGSVVVKNVKDETVVVGNPAHETKAVADIVCQYGGKLHHPYRDPSKPNL